MLAVPHMSTAAAAASHILPAAVIACLAAWTLLEFVPQTRQRAGVLVYWVVMLAASLLAMHIVAHRTRVPQIILRKGYHLLAMALFVPVFFWDGPMLAVSLAVAFAALAAVEVVRCAGVPQLGAAVQRFMQDFTDERDAGAIYVTHFTLLLGLALPVWVTPALPKSPAASGPTLLAVLAGLSGLMAVGVGDTAASVVGRLVGRRPIHIGSKKTVEGTLAGICCTLVSWWLVLRWLGGDSGVTGVTGDGAVGGFGGVLSGQQWLRLVACTAGAGLLEACTSQLDNIMIPMYYLTHMLLMDMR
jgi:dolichol kinase